MVDRPKKKRVLVTRPIQQAKKLCALINHLGVETLLFPTIEIKEIGHNRFLSTLFGDIEQYDYLIFVSRNAARIAFERHLPKTGSPGKPHIIAVGQGTSDTLHTFGVNNVICPTKSFDSENLLALKELSVENVAHKNILIVRGIGGRGLLADTLIQRGATVRYAEIYQRCLPLIKPDKIELIWQQQLAAIIVTSNESLKNLVVLMGEKWYPNMVKTPLISLSAKIAALAIDYGFRSKLVVAKNKTDASLVAALNQILE